MCSWLVQRGERWYRGGALGAPCNVHCALCAAHDSPRAAKATPMEEFVYCSRSWLRREAPVLLARSLAVNRASTPPFFGLVALVGLVTARCPLGSSAWTWVSSASTAGAVCSCEWCVRDLTYCCPLPTHGERQPEPRGIPFMPHCNRHHRVLCRPDAAPVPGLEEESVLVLQVSTTSVHLWFMLGIVPARVGVEVRVWRRLWVISSGRLPDAAPRGCHLRCASCVSCLGDAMACVCMASE